MIQNTEELNKFIEKLQNFDGILKLNGEEVIYWNTDEDPESYDEDEVNDCALFLFVTEKDICFSEKGITAFETINETNYVMRAFDLDGNELNLAFKFYVN